MIKLPCIFFIVAVLDEYVYLSWENKSVLWDTSITDTDTEDLIQCASV